MVERWSNILVPIYTEKENYNGVAQPLGTAFLASYRGAVFLVTALHTVKEHTDKLLVIGISNQAVQLDKMPFAVSEKDDLAVAYLDELWALNNDLKSVSTIPIDNPDREYYSLGRYFLMGFPGKRNILNLRTGKVTKNIHGTSFSTQIENPKANTHINNPVAFEFDKKQAILTSGDKITPPRFNGNSGGPVMELIGRPDNSGGITIRCKLAGVFVGWCKIEKEAIAIRPEAITKLIGKSYLSR